MSCVKHTTGIKMGFLPKTRKSVRRIATVTSVLIVRLGPKSWEQIGNPRKLGKSLCRIL